MTKAKLEQLREKIEFIDAAIIEKLAERQALVREIGQLKIGSGKEILDPSRERHLLHYYKNLCDQYQLDPVFVQKLFEIVFLHSRDLQK